MGECHSLIEKHAELEVWFKGLESSHPTITEDVEGVIGVWIKAINLANGPGTVEEWNFLVKTRARMMADVLGRWLEVPPWDPRPRTYERSVSLWAFENDEVFSQS